MSIHKSLGIPCKYLTKLMKKNFDSGLLQVTIGKNGGYQLIKPAQEITLCDIINISENLGALDQCIMGQFSICKTPRYPMHSCLL